MGLTGVEPRPSQHRDDRLSERPLVSVIIIFLNAGRFLSEAVESVLAQTYERWELLLVDDGSSDEGTAIAKEYARTYATRVRYLEHEGHQNLGMSAARNLGLRQASGEFVSFVDADDVILPHTLAEQVALLRQHPEAALVFGPIEWWYSWKGKQEDARRDFVEDLRLPLNTLIDPPNLVALFLQDKAGVPSGFLVRRSAVARAGGFEEAFRGEYEDQVFMAKLCLREPVFAASNSWYRYRQHEDSCVAQGQRTGQTHSARYRFLTWLEQHLTKNEVERGEVWRALRAELLPYRQPLSHRLRQSAIRLTRGMIGRGLPLARRLIPLTARKRLYFLWRQTQGQPAVGRVRLGHLRRVTPISRDWGFERGLPVDRYYIERFLLANALDITGRVLEVADDAYTRRFGLERVTQSDVLHVEAGDPRATIVADLADGDNIPSDAFDCVILTQTLQLVYDLRAAVLTVHRILKPGGVVLATFPGISQISRYDMDRWGYYWSLTTRSAERLFGEAFAGGDVRVEAQGNVLAAVALLQGMAAEELRPEELDHRDPDYQVTISVRAQKSRVVP